MVEVANTGSYIAPEEHERIFQPFVSGRAGGTGLGLAIAQQIVFAHGASCRYAVSAIAALSSRFVYP